MVSDKSLIAIMLVCVAAVGISAAIKVSESSQHAPAPLMVVPRHTIVEPDPAFFDQAKSDAAAQAAAKPSVPTGPVRLPGITASAYLIGDTANAKIYLEYNSRKVLPVASMSKLVTAFVITDMAPATTTIVITDAVLLAPPDKSNLMIGERFTLADILYPLLLNSSNIAAEAISSSTKNRVNFLEMMSSYAWEVGMPNSFFADPSGVDPHNAASARDMFGLAQYLVNYRPDILAITRIPSVAVATTTEHGRHIFESTHPFVTDPRFIGGKTGRTPEAGETMLTIMNIAGQKVALIVLGSQNRENDTKILIRKVEGMLK